MNERTAEDALCIIVNGRPVETTVAPLREVLEALGFELEFAAVAVNETLIPRARIESMMPGDGDRIEVVMPMEGG